MSIPLCRACAAQVHGGVMATGGQPPHSPRELYDAAMKIHPTDRDAAFAEYRALMIHHGHIVKAKPGEDRNLPCGWPGLPPATERAPEAMCTDGGCPDWEFPHPPHNASSPVPRSEPGAPEDG